MLLVYRRTKLIGVFTLLPVMVNICLLNFFYGFETGEQVHAVVLLLGLLYLLFEEYPRLTAVFLAKPKPDPVLGRRYVVTRLWMNEVELSPGNWSDSMMERVYFDRGDHCTVMYRGGEKMRPGDFVYNENSVLVRVSWYYPAGLSDSLVARVRVIPGAWAGWKDGKNTCPDGVGAKALMQFSAFSEGKLVAARRKF